jgi:hypothetical protein
LIIAINSLNYSNPSRYNVMCTFEGQSMPDRSLSYSTSKIGSEPRCRKHKDRIIVLAMRLLHITPHLVLGSTEPTLTKERQRPLLRVKGHFHTLYIIYPRRSIIHNRIPLVVTYSFAFCPSGLLLPHHIITYMSGGSVYWLDVFLASHLLGLKPRRWALAVRLPLDFRF